MINRNRQADIAEISNSLSFYALIFLTVLFLLIVGYGWSTMLVPAVSIPDGWPEMLNPIFTMLRYVLGTAIALAGVTLAKAVAAERIRISTEEQPKFKNTWIAYIVVLLLISALGTMNTMFMQTRASSFLGDAISKTRNQLQELKFKIDATLSTPAYDQQRADIALLFVNFENELRNPANCGFGAQANERFRELQALIPKLKPLALGSGACQNVEALLTAYKSSIDQLTEDLPDPATKKRYQQRKDFISQIEKTIAGIEEMKVLNARLSRDAAMPVLTSAWNIYAQILKETELMAGSPLGLPEKIDDQNVQGMGNITQIIPLLIERFNDPLTYMIITAAVFFDFLLIAFFSRYLHSRVVMRRETFYTAQPGVATSRARNLFEE